MNLRGTLVHFENSKAKTSAGISIHTNVYELIPIYLSKVFNFTTIIKHFPSVALTKLSEKKQYS